MKLSVPGNLLIAGEYFITLKGGSGLALAIEPRVNAIAHAASSWSLEAIMGKQRLRWAPDAAKELPLVTALFEAAHFEWNRLSLSPLPQTISLDSSAFFSPDGRKSGFGSSAASAVALATILGAAAGLAEEQLAGFALRVALAGHRAAQGGRGSGYDVYASAHGGIGLFTGGTLPRWNVLPSFILPPGILFPGPHPVSSAKAVTRFNTWRQANQDYAKLLLKRSMSAVSNLSRSSSPTEFLDRLIEARDAGIMIGDALGVPARLVPPPGPGTMVVKASGAGDELGMAFFATDVAVPVGYPYPALRPAEGPQWLS